MVESRQYDVAIVGSGIVGLAHAVAAHRAGMSVVVVDRAPAILGASVRNFGHICLTAQSGLARELGEESRELWLRLADEAGFWLQESGTIVAARAGDEYAILEEFRDLRGEAAVELLSAEEVRERAPIADPALVGGAWLPRDLQVDPREASEAIAWWLEREGVTFRLRTTALGVETGLVRTNRGDIRASTVIVAVNHDIDQLFPDVAESAGVLRCGLDMMLVDVDLPIPLGAPLFTGWSMVRYAGFRETAAAASVTERLTAEFPELRELDLNQMYTQRLDGSLILGDTHYRSSGEPPFQDEFAFETLLDQARTLFGTDSIRVRERWQGVYASAANDFLIESPIDRVHVVSVTTGVGMTTALALGARIIAGVRVETEAEGTHELQTERQL